MQGAQASGGAAAAGFLWRISPVRKVPSFGRMAWNRWMNNHVRHGPTHKALFFIVGLFDLSGGEPQHW